MQRRFLLILALWGWLFAFPVTSNPLTPNPFNIDEVILDIYNAVTEFGEVDYEQLQTDLYTLHESPIDLNNTSDEELTQLYFLSPQQIDAILAYAYRHPFESLYELRLIPELADYEIRDLLPFVQITNHLSPMSFTRKKFSLKLTMRLSPASMRGISKRTKEPTLFTPSFVIVLISGAV